MAMEEGADVHGGFVLSCLPAQAISAPIFSAAAGDYDGEDRISQLPNHLLRLVVSRLSIKDAVHTTVLSKRWEQLWGSLPLAFSDEQLCTAPESTRLAAIQDALYSHPGPFRSIHIARVDFQQRHLNEWTPLLVNGHVKDLVLVRRTRSEVVRLPPDIFSCSELRRLYLGSLVFPHQLPYGAISIPELEELVILNSSVTQTLLEQIVAHSTKLKMLGLCLVHTPFLDAPPSLAGPLSVCVRGESLLGIQICCFIGSEIKVTETPCLDRILLWKAFPMAQWGGRQPILKVTIDATPKVLGYLDAGVHLLCIGKIFVKANASVTPKTMVQSVRCLAVRVHIGVRAQMKIMARWLECFPNVEVLHFESASPNEPISAADCDVYKEIGPMGGELSQIQTVFLHAFSGSPRELEFLKYILHKAISLENVTLVMRRSSDGEIDIQATVSTILPWACEGCTISLLMAKQVVPGVLDSDWDFRRAFDLSIEDPFDLPHDKVLLSFKKGSSSMMLV